MAEYAEITNGKVSNIIIADTSPGDDWVDVTNTTITYTHTLTDTNTVATETEKVAPGDSYSNGSFSRNLDTETAADNERIAKTLLAESDWTVLNDVGLTSTNVQEWKTYRASLRAIAKSPSAGTTTWPVKPSKEYS